MFSQLLKTIAVTLLCMAHAATHADDQTLETTSARYQATYNWQWHPSFSGSVMPSSKSLISTSERMYTFSATAHWGARLWEGSEIYINPEIASGIPFSSDLVGLGGFTNGEITRAGGSDPKLYLQRLFYVRPGIRVVAQKLLNQILIRWLGKSIKIGLYSPSVISLRWMCLMTIPMPKILELNS